MAVKPSFSDTFSLALRTQYDGVRRFLRHPLGGPAACVSALLLLNPGLRLGGFAFVAAAIASLAVVPVGVAFVLSLSRGFRQRARAMKIQEVRADMLEKLYGLVQNLRKPSRQRFDVLHSRVARLSDLLENRDAPIRPGEQLLWLYLKLLLVRDHLDELDSSVDLSALEADQARLEEELRNPSLSEAARNSRLETLQLIERRILACRQRSVRIDEVESDLARIEHKVALLHDRAAQQSTLGDAGVLIDMFSDSPTALAPLPAAASSQVEDLDAFFAAHMES